MLNSPRFTGSFEQGADFRPLWKSRPDVDQDYLSYFKGDSLKDIEPFLK